MPAAQSWASSNFQPARRLDVAVYTLPFSTYSRQVTHRPPRQALGYRSVGSFAVARSLHSAVPAASADRLCLFCCRCCSVRSLLTCMRILIQPPAGGALRDEAGSVGRRQGSVRLQVARHRVASAVKARQAVEAPKAPGSDSGFTDLPKNREEIPVTTPIRSKDMQASPLLMPCSF